jgi:hypothetical protein
MWLLFVIVISRTPSLDAAPNERRVYESLLRDYDHRVRPVANSSDTLVVHLGLVLQQIVNVVRYYCHSLLNENVVSFRTKRINL